MADSFSSIDPSLFGPAEVQPKAQGEHLSSTFTGNYLISWPTKQQTLAQASRSQRAAGGKRARKHLSVYQRRGSAHTGFVYNKARPSQFVCKQAPE